MPVPLERASLDQASLELLTYEQAFVRLEAILERLEEGDLPLEESLSLFEEGAALAAYCARRLDEAELRVRQWQPGDQTIAFDGWRESLGRA